MVSHNFAPLKNDLILRAARGERVPKTPVWVMRQAGRYLPEYHEVKGKNDFFECCRTPEIACALTLQPIDRFGSLLDAAIIFSDILVIPQALGMTVEMVDKKGPHFPDPLRTPEDEQYSQILDRQVDIAKELKYVYDAITLTRTRLDGRVPLLGFAGAPWTLMSYMIEGGGSKMFKDAKTWVYKYQSESERLLQKITDCLVEHLALQVQAGAQMLQVFESWAGELSPASFSRFSLPYLTQIADRVPVRVKELGLEPVPMTVFAKGAWYALEDLCQTNYNVVSLDWLHNPADARKVAKKYGKTLQGNADPGVLYGSRDAIAEVVDDMVRGFEGGHQGWIANLGHGITPFVDPENLRFFFEKIRDATSESS